MAHMRNLFWMMVVAMLAGLGMANFANAADAQLSGTIASSSGEKLGGVTVSAKKIGSTITTSVYTDASGNYYFPPMAEGRYRVWAQALDFDTAKGEVDLPASKRQNLTLTAIADPEKRWRQLPSEMMVTALPESTAADAHIKQIFMTQCTSCHPPSYPLQFRFDETGWNRVINLMKVILSTGVREDHHPPNQIMEMNQKDLAAYLARVRGPGQSEAKVKPRARPSGEAARAVWTLYDVARVEGVGVSALGLNEPDTDGTDWSQGTPSKLGFIIHDEVLDFDGNMWFTSNSTNMLGSIGRVDAKTGEVTYRKVPRADGSGRAALTHGLARDGQGNLWFDINPGRRSLGKVDPKTGQITVYPTSEPMSPLGGGVTVDVDGKGMIWASSPDGVLRFNPTTAEFTEFKDSVWKRPNGIGTSYGAAGDRDGNGWWTEMAWDIVGKADAKSGKVVEIQLPEDKEELDRLTPAQRAAYDKVTDISTGSPYPWSQGPRRMGTDKNADVLWVCDSWGSNLARIDTHTNAVTMIPMPEKALQPYHVAVDSKHNVWGDLWTSDEVFKYDPSNATWTMFDLPVRGGESRHISIDERGGVMKVTAPIYRTNQIGIMTVRSEAELMALKARASR